LESFRSPDSLGQLKDFFIGIALEPGHGEFDSKTDGGLGDCTGVASLKDFSGILEE
jgi:hypothetical protein